MPILCLQDKDNGMEGSLMVFLPLLMLRQHCKWGCSLREVSEYCWVAPGLQASWCFPRPHCLLEYSYHEQQSTDMLVPLSCFVAAAVNTPLRAGGVEPLHAFAAKKYVSCFVSQQKCSRHDHEAKITAIVISSANVQTVLKRITNSSYFSIVITPACEMIYQHIPGLSPSNCTVPSQLACVNSQHTSMKFQWNKWSLNISSSSITSGWKPHSLANDHWSWLRNDAKSSTTTLWQQPVSCALAVYFKTCSYGIRRASC